MLEREFIRRDEPGAGEQHAACWKSILAHEPAREFVKSALHLRNGRRAGEHFRAAAAEDRTGQAIMQVMLKRAQSRPITFYSEFFALDLLMSNIVIQFVESVDWRFVDVFELTGWVKEWFGNVFVHQMSSPKANRWRWFPMAR